MSKDNSKIFRKSFVRQHDAKDCGVACLLSAIKIEGYHSSLEYLREISGTNNTGTSLYGLKQAAIQVGFDAETYYAESIEELFLHKNLAILHVVKNEVFEHFILVYPDHVKGDFFVIDPDFGFSKGSKKEIEVIWQSNALLSLKSTNSLHLPLDKSNRVIDWLKPIIKEYQNKLIIIVVLGLFSSLLAFSTAVFTEKLVDDLLPSGNSKVVTLGLVAWISLLLLAVGLGFIHRLTAMRFSLEFNTWITDHFFGKLLFLPKVFFRSKKTGDLITRMEDIEEIENGVISWVERGIVSLFIIFVSLFLLFIYDKGLATISALFLPFLFLTTLWVRQRIIEVHRNSMIAHSLSNANYIDVVTGIDTIKSRNLEKNFTDVTVKLYRAFRQRIFDAQLIGLKFGTVIQVISLVSSAVIVSLSSYKVLYGSLEIGNMLAIISISSLASSSTIALVSVYIGFQESKVAFERINDVTYDRLEKQEFNDERLSELPLKIELKGISYSFPGEDFLFTDITLGIKRGYITTLLGETGSGKSTLINVIQLLLKPDVGEILYNGIAVNALIFSWRKMVSIVPQEIKIFNTTIWENILLESSNDPKHTIEKVDTFIGQYQAFSFIQSLPNGLNTILGEGGVSLSGGQKQLLGLARALISNPNFLILDEPTSALDRNTEKLILALLQEIKLEIPILLVTHNLISAYQTDFIYILEKGQIEVQGTPKNLLNSDNIFSEFFKDLPPSIKD